jgi:hypothetical protein
MVRLGPAKEPLIYGRGSAGHTLGCAPGEGVRFPASPQFMRNSHDYRQN